MDSRITTGLCITSIHLMSRSLIDTKCYAGMMHDQDDVHAT